ncbi:MAG: ABC transporter ATP-binding protein [Chloroflexota bacterium]
MPRFQIEDVRKIYSGGVVANDDISLEIRAGEVYGLLGPNGAGKSTLVQQMVALLRPDAGRILYEGRAVVPGAPWLKRSIAYLSQRPLALFDLTVREALTYTGQLRGLPRSKARVETDTLLESLALSSAADRIVARLSGGQHRLVALGSSLIGDAETLVLDEPTNELDPQMRRQVWAALRERCHSRGTTIVLVTHNALEAEGVLDRLSVLMGGKLICSGTPGEIKAQVDSRVRIELTFREPPTGRIMALNAISALVQTTPHCLTLSAPRNEARGVIDRVLGVVPLEDLDDFRVLTPTLEDVYLEVARQDVSA